MRFFKTALGVSAAMALSATANAMFPADYNPPGFAVFGREEVRTLFPDPAEPVFQIPF